MSVWIAGATLVVGVGMGVAGNAQQRVANNKANDANAKNIENSNKLAWQQYLMSRGINGGTNTEPGQMPQNGVFVNASLPLYANIGGDGKFAARTPRNPLGSGTPDPTNYSRPLSMLPRGSTSSPTPSTSSTGISLPANYDYAEPLKGYASGGFVKTPGIDYGGTDEGPGGMGDFTLYSGGSMPGMGDFGGPGPIGAPTDSIFGGTTPGVYMDPKRLGGAGGNMRIPMDKFGNPMPVRQLPPSDQGVDMIGKLPNDGLGGAGGVMDMGKFGNMRPVQRVISDQGVDMIGKPPNDGLGGAGGNMDPTPKFRDLQTFSRPSRPAAPMFRLGYTGRGGVSEPAGVVHRGEYVVPARAVSRIGVSKLDQMVAKRAMAVA